jgi:hypothetical protein
MLGEMTVSVLKGEDGFQRKEIDKFVDWVKDRRRPTSSICLTRCCSASLAHSSKH